jgi:hypothetical protein
MQFGACLEIGLSVLCSATVFELESDQMLKKKLSPENKLCLKIV